MQPANTKKYSLPVEMPEDLNGDLSFFSSLQNASEIEDHHEGQLSVDVAETDNELLIVAPMAGAPKGNIELHLNNDLLTIRGDRKSPVPDGAYYHFSECYWGKFSRSIVLPVDVYLEAAKAEYYFGLLTVRLPKVKVDQTIPITIVEE
ncbi:MAG: Hsp20/alpha crystallin family protein [Candidatus Magasanikbacteria bacterium]|nr:Hsp20/alpha crystallin family protein [Candidatus Magasanikbacteria bacterium]